MTIEGGEKIIEALCEMFPTADIYTHIYKPEKLPKTITSHKIHVSFISKLPFAKKILSLLSTINADCTTLS